MHRSVIAFAAAAAATIVSVAAASADEGWPMASPEMSRGVAAKTAAHTLTQADLDSWLGDAVPRALSRDGIAGAVVVVVKDDKVLNESGFGYSDVAAKKRVDPPTTLFRLASVSKLFTWTAVMQLAEERKLDLDVDINTYLDFRIPATWPKPITLRNLMTHTSGFEEANKNTYAPDAASMPALGALLKSWVPKRMYPPGTVVAYSNYGAALAGYIVERVAHERFEDYVAHHILMPLGMAHSTFEQPLPAALSADLSKGYLTSSGAAMPFEYVELRAAGGLSSTGADVARFMMAQLNDGALGDAKILDAQSARAMHREAWRQDPGLPGMGLGFWHLDRNGHTIIAHTGDTALFHSGLYLLTDAHVGLFVAANSAGSDGDFPHDMFEAFVARYFPGAPVQPQRTLPSAHAHGQMVAGTYESSRRADSNFMIAEEVFNERTVTLNPDDTITLSGSRDVQGNERVWREIAPFRWQETAGDRVLDAQVKDGRVVALMSDASAPNAMLVPAPFFRSETWNAPLFLATIGLLLLAAVLWPVGGIIRSWRGVPLPLSGSAATGWRLTRLAVLSDLIFLCGWAEFLSYSDSHVEVMNAKSDWLLRVLQVFGCLGVAGAVVAVWFAVFALLRSRLPVWSRLWNVIVAVACVATVWFAFSLRLISWTLNY